MSIVARGLAIGTAAILVTAGYGLKATEPPVVIGGGFAPIRIPLRHSELPLYLLLEDEEIVLSAAVAAIRAFYESE